MPKKRALLCSMDGVRPDAIQATDTPTIDRLVHEGSFTWKARSIMPSVTLPCHTSMFRGVTPSRHGITDNLYHPLARPVPSFVDIAKRERFLTGFFGNWEELRDLSAPGSYNVALHYDPQRNNISQLENFLINEKVQSRMICEILEEVDFDFIFLYIGSPDIAGHANGWMSESYLRAVAWADRYLGIVLEKLMKLGRFEETCVLVQSDHGGHQKTHGTDTPEDMTIPWILRGPGVRRGYEITGEVNIYDTCVTLAHILGLPPSDQWEGKIITEVIEGSSTF